MIVVWRVTTACSLSCGFCAYDRRVLRPRHEIDLATVLRFAARLEGRAMLSLLGGEPFMWKPLARLEAESRVALSITTSGLNVPVERVAGRYREITFSLDGVGAVHDRLRGWPGGYQRVMSTIDALRRREVRPLIRVNSVLMHATVRDFPALLGELADHGVDEVTFNQLGGVDRPEFHARHGLTVDDARWIARELPAWQAAMAARGVRLGGSSAYGERFLASARGQRLPVDDCRPGRSFLFIDEHGRASPCSHVGVGLPVEQLDDLDALPARFAALRARHLPVVCGDCPSTQVRGKFERAQA